VKKISLLLMLFVLACVGRELFDYISARQAAYLAYEDQATKLARSHRRDLPFADIGGYIIDVMYDLESITRKTEHEFEIVAVQAVHFQRGLPFLNWGARQIVKTRQKALMRRSEGQWLVSELEENTSAPAYLSESVIPE